MIYDFCSPRRWPVSKMGRICPPPAYHRVGNELLCVCPVALGDRINERGDEQLLHTGIQHPMSGAPLVGPYAVRHVLLSP